MVVEAAKVPVGLVYDERVVSETCSADAERRRLEVTSPCNGMFSWVRLPSNGVHQSALAGCSRR